MKKIGILSDTHGYFHPKIPDIFSQCDEIWHCGDFGSLDIIEKLKLVKPLKGVYGNIDSYEIRSEFPEHLIFYCEEVEVCIKHIGGYPGRYDKTAQMLIQQEKPDLFICGHSHILKVMHDKKNNLLHINPGAAGKFGIHNVITFVRLTVKGKKIEDLEVVEYPKFPDK